MRAHEIASIVSLVQSLRAELRQCMADVRDRRCKQGAAARGQRGGFVQNLKRAGLGANATRKATAGVKHPAAKTPRLAGDQPGFVQNILGMRRPRKIA